MCRARRQRRRTYVLLSIWSAVMQPVGSCGDRLHVWALVARVGQTVAMGIELAGRPTFGRAELLLSLAMSTEEILGLWYCHTVDQEQSEDEEDEFGEYDDWGREPQKASETEHAQTKLEVRDDGTYAQTGSDDYMSSTGTWTLDGSNLKITEKEPAGGYDGLEYATFRGSSLTLAYKLIPDAHDGLDVLVLTFTRDEPEARGSKR